MQHLQLVISALLGACGVFHVVCGLPAGGSRYAKIEAMRKLSFVMTFDPVVTGLGINNDADISDTLAHILVSLSHSPQYGGIYYRLAEIFSQKIQERGIAPNFTKAWLAICYIVDRTRVPIGEEQTIADKIEEALKLFYDCGSSDNESPNAIFQGLVPLIQNAANSDPEVAKEIVVRLANHFLDFEELRGMDIDTRVSVLQEITEELQPWADMIENQKSIEEAEHLDAVLFDFVN